MKQISFILATLIFFILGISNAWALPNCVGSWSTLWKNCFGTYEWDNGDIYTGEWKDSKNRTGKGTYIFGTNSKWSDDKYIGMFRNNKIHGLGTYTFGPKSKWAGDEYTGEFIEDERTGYGTYIHSNGDKYTGYHKKANRHGQGTYTYADGSKEIGRYENNKLNGYAIVYYADGSIKYKGIFKDNKFLYSQSNTLPACPTTGYFHDCFGSITFKNGDMYLGEFKNDKLDGQGTYTFGANSQWPGDKYIGEYKNSKRDGQGTYTFADGEEYIGQYKNGIRDGQGTYTFADGEKYVGEYKNGKQNGQGTYSYSNGDKYIGEFKNNKRDGQGTYTFADGEKYVGEYKNGKQNGQGTYSYLNGDKYVGEFKDSYFNGQGTFTYGSNTKWAGYKYVGEFENDKRNGQGTFTFADGRKEVGTYKNDLLNGYGIRYFANGTIDKEGIFKDDEFLYSQTKTLPACPTSGYFHNCFGNFVYDGGGKYAGEWQNDERNGHGTYTYPNGNKYVGKFKNGKKNGYGIFTWSGGDKYQGEWENDERNGQGAYAWADGDKYQGEWKNDQTNGQGTYTWKNGDKYVGQHIYNSRTGKGTYTYSPRSEWAGHKYVGDFKDGLFSGQGTYTYADGSRDVGTWKNDKLNGYAIKYFANGSIKQEGIFKDDEWLYAEESSPNILNEGNQDNKVINASSGSGFAVSLDGYVITNNHVIEGCQEVILHTKEKDIKTRIISFDPQNDLALLKGDFQPRTVFALSNNRPELLQDIYVAGYPFGNAISSSIKVTKGIISSLTGIGNNFSNIQIDAALQSGNSGGPIIDDYGNVIAVAVSKLDAKYMLENFGSIPENTNFGIKSSVVKSMLDSNDVDRPNANQNEISKTKLGKMISSGTYYISCWMTQAQIELLKSKKVLFEGLH